MHIKDTNTWGLISSLKLAIATHRKSSLTGRNVFDPRGNQMGVSTDVARKTSGLFCDIVVGPNTSEGPILQSIFITKSRQPGMRHSEILK